MSAPPPIARPIAPPGAPGSAPGIAPGSTPVTPAGTAPRITEDWIGQGAAPVVIAALGGAAFFVGGCVRNALLGAPATDLDLATPLTPEAVTERLEAAGLKAVPTGIEHGTITAVWEGHPVEITTFRADVETDGRRAVVRFTTDMAEDAARRDFTVNALYADAEGQVLDPIGGLPDLRARRLRFIGDPVARIREDRLRILRFFRFTAWYAEGMDAGGLAACRAEAVGVEALAHERLGTEMRKLLAAPDPVAATSAMAEAGVLARVLPGAEAAPLAALLARERAAGMGPHWPTRLAAVGGQDPEAALRLSRAEGRLLAAILRVAEAQMPPAQAAEAEGAEAARAGSLVRAARRGSPLPEDFEAAIARGTGAVMPLAAADLIAAGWRPGPALGRALAEARALWRASDFTLDRAALIEEVGGKGQ